MKNLILLITMLIGANVFAAAPRAATLECWKTHFTHARVPFMSAVIEDDHILSNIRFHYRENGVIPAAPKGEVEGQLITSNRSPYKGMNNFNIQTSFYGMERLILPADLSSRNLAALTRAYYKGENAVIIGNFNGDGAGSHFSVRLICRSNKR